MYEEKMIPIPRCSLCGRPLIAVAMNHNIIRFRCSDYSVFARDHDDYHISTTELCDVINGNKSSFNSHTP